MAWVTRSSDGWQTIEWRPTRICKIEESDIVFVELKIAGQHWDPCDLAETGSYNLAPHYECLLPSVALELEKLETLLQYLRAPQQLATGFTLQLSPKTYQSVVLMIGVRDDFISSSDKPALTLQYDATRLHSEWVMGLDDSCIEEWVSQMESWRSQLA